MSNLKFVTKVNTYYKLIIMLTRWWMKGVKKKDE